MNLPIIMPVKLNKNQRQLTSEIFGNIAVTWFAFDVVSPFFIKEINVINLLKSTLTGLLAATIFFYIALKVIKR